MSRKWKSAWVIGSGWPKCWTCRGSHRQCCSRTWFWCDWLRQRDTQAFLALRNSLEQQEQALEERRASISDAEYYAGYSSLYKVFQEKTAELIHSLSEEAVRWNLGDVARLRRLHG